MVLLPDMEIPQFTRRRISQEIPRSIYKITFCVCVCYVCHGI